MTLGGGSRTGHRSMVDHLVLDFEKDIPQQLPKRYATDLVSQHPEKLTIVGHSAYYDVEDGETYALVELY